MDAKSELLNRLLILWAEEPHHNPAQRIQGILEDYAVIHEDEGGKSNLKKRISYFLGAKRIDGLSSKTLENYRFTLNLFAAQVNKHITKITTDDIWEYIAYLSEERRLKGEQLADPHQYVAYFFRLAPCGGCA